MIEKQGREIGRTKDRGGQYKVYSETTYLNIEQSELRIVYQQGHLGLLRSRQ